MNIPFSPEQFFGVFVGYNTTIWPTQIVLNLLAVVAIALCLRPNVPSRIVSAILGALWMWTGVVYHIMFFSTVNPAAFLFGLIFVAQGFLFVVLGSFRQALMFRFQRTLRGYAGWVLIVYGLLVYPLLGYLLGHVYPASPTFGAPCPSTIFTLGLLLWTTNKVKPYLFILPFLWSIVGFLAALSLGVFEDVGLLLAGVVGTALLTMRSGAGTPMTSG
jgi:hypothetical protein